MKVGLITQKMKCFFQTVFPFLPNESLDEQLLKGYETKKYYKPLRGFPVSSQLFDKIVCFPITEGITYG